MLKMITPREAAQRIGMSYPALKQWIYSGKLHSVRTPGGHHRIPETEIDRFLNLSRDRAAKPAKRRESWRKISGRNQLVGRVTEVKIEGLLAQIKLSIGGQSITSIITADAAREMRLKTGDTASALIKSTEVMIVRP